MNPFRQLTHEFLNLVSGSRDYLQVLSAPDEWIKLGRNCHGCGTFIVGSEDGLRTPQPFPDHVVRWIDGRGPDWIRDRDSQENSNSAEKFFTAICLDAEMGESTPEADVKLSDLPETSWLIALMATQSEDGPLFGLAMALNSGVTEGAANFETSDFTGFFRDLVSAMTGLCSGIDTYRNLHRELEEQYEEFNILYEQLHWFHHIAASIKSVHDIGALALEIIDTVDALFIDLSARLLIIGRPGDTLRVESRDFPGGTPRIPPPMENGVIRTVYGSGMAIMKSDGNAGNLRLEITGPADAGSYIVVPLKAAGVVEGIILIFRSSGDFSETERNLLLKMGEQAARAVENYRLYMESMEKQKIENDLSLAHTIQQKLLPKEYPYIRGYDFYGVNIPAKSVGGDYFDLFPVPGENGQNLMAAVVADVSGKGVPASLVMAATRSFLRAAAVHSDSPAKILETVNTHVLRDTGSGMYVTMFYSVLDMNTGEMVFSKAGHNPPLVIRSDGSMITLDAQGLFLGMFDDGMFAEERTAIDIGDKVVLFTDGVVEAMNPSGDEFRLSRFQDVLNECSQLDAISTVKKTWDCVRTFVEDAPAHDDFTILVIQRRDPFFRKSSMPALPELKAEYLDRIIGDVEVCTGREDIVMVMRMAMDELLSNALEHGPAGDTKWIDITIDIGPESISAVITDQGAGFDHASVMAANNGKKAENAPNMGLFIVSRLMDHVEFNGSGNSVTIVKRVEDS
ncbi:MAG: hypothetical protein CVV64_06000 [Candidatus Wallbacteria bacterium HGW-Wallbacteria-1]|uniref:PPM-type phosphatase domain-containing protein n=1 Tax=Candidatus Wallbacteria bacterium HGW-Wallbacteria-1 TaxID=2013854 RepID=A0A2N1PSK1_9BACT|nr:MAG: hypothetical protein CVV64_06000 [Candidatus Wallbacteria bacterium HGW-Wallbacteria-1]